MSAHPQERLSALLDGELSPDERAQVQRHLDSCDACVQELSELALVDRMGRELEVAAPEGYVEALPARLRPRLRAARRRVPPPWMLALAAVMLIGVLIPIAWRRHPLEAPAPASAPLEQQAQPAARPPGAQPTQASPELQKSVGETTRRVEPAPQAAETRFAPPPPPPPPQADAAPEAPRELKENLDDKLEAREPARENKPLPPQTLGADVRQRELGVAGGARDQAPGPAAAPAPKNAPARAQAAPPAAPPPAAAPAPTAAPAGAATTTTGALAPGDKLEADAELARQGRADTSREAYAKDEDLGFTDDKARKKAATSAEGFAQIAKHPLETAAQARQIRRAWREFADRHPQDPLADEARARAVEAASLAYRLSGEPADRRTLEDDVRAYLKRGDAAHKQRVRALAAEPPP